MNIIHLLSQTHLTGAEVYAASLADKQLASGLKVYQISNGFYAPTSAIPFTLEVETKSKFTFLNNVLWLRNFINKENIHVIHSHSRAAAKLAFYATIFSNTAHVSTIHGRQHPSFSKKLLNQYGEFIISVCENVKKQILRDFNYNERIMRVIANPIDVNKFSRSNSKVKNSDTTQDPKIAIVGRATGPKKERSKLVILCLLRNRSQFGHFKLVLVGSRFNEIINDDELKSLNLLEAKNELEIEEVEIPELTGRHYSQWDIVIGSGRVAMEAAISETPVIAFGEALFEGCLSLQNLDSFIKSNFGDMHPDHYNPSLSDELFIRAFQAALNMSRSELKQISEKMNQGFSADLVHLKIKRLYESAYFQKNYSSWIPVLMYHKIPEREIQSQHKIFVTKTNFEKHLKFFKWRGFNTLTFSELSLFRTGLLSFKSFPKKPLILTFDDGYQDNLSHASPLLKNYGYKAQIFLLADSGLKSNTWDTGENEPTHEIVSGADRLKWKESAFEIGSHGFRHQPITDFKNSSDALAELKNSKKSLEAEFGQPINSFAFTYGITTPGCDQLAFEAGYDYALNTDSGAFRLEENPYAIFRVNIFPDESYWSLFKKTSSWYRRYYYFKRRK